MSTLFLTIRRARLLAEVRIRRRVIWSAQAQLQGPEEVARAIAHLGAAEGFPARVRWAEALLDEGAIQRRLLRDVPPVRQCTLDELVRLQQQRFFRRNGVPLVTRAHWQRTGSGAPRVAEAVAVEAPLLDAIADGVATAGLRLRKVVAQGSDLEFVSEQEVRRRQEWAKRLLRCLVVANTLVWLGAATAHVAGLLLANHRLSEELTQLREPSAALLRARRELSSATGMISAIEQSQAQRAALAMRIAEIVRALPDSAYLTSLALSSQGVGRLTASARDPAAVIARLEQVTGLPTPRREGEPVMEPEAGWQRITVSFGEGGLQ